MVKNIFIFIFIVSFIFGCAVNDPEIKLELSDKYLKFIFKDKKTILDYEILDMEDYNYQNGTYRKILEKKDVNEEFSELIIIKKNNSELVSNHAYIFSSGISGEKNQPGVVLKSFIFCFRNNTVITQDKLESDESFILRCKGLT